MSTHLHVVQGNDHNFETEVLRSDVPVLVDFGATWCKPCVALAKIVEEIARENVGRLKVVAVDIDDAPATAARYGVRAAPTVIVFASGEKQSQRVGLTTKSKLLEMIPELKRPTIAKDRRSDTSAL